MKADRKLFFKLISTCAILWCASISARSEPIRVPLSFELNTVVIEDVYLDGTGPFRALVDTGSTLNVIDSAIAHDLQLTADSNIDAEATGGNISSGVYNGPEVHLGDIILLEKDSPFIAGPVRKQYGMVEEKIDLVLGAPFIRRYTPEFWLDERLLLLHETGAFTPPGQAVAVDFRIEMDLPVIVAAVEGEEANLVLDIGSNAALDLFPRFMERSDLTQRHTVYRVPIIGLGGQVEARLLRAESLAFGEFEFSDVRIYAHAAGIGEFDGLVGCEILRRFHFIIDYQNRKVFFVPNDKLNTPWIEELAGITVINDLGSYRVTSVSEGSPAHEAGLRAGDSIIEIDGRKAYEVGIPKMRELVRQPQGTTLEIRARRGTNIIEAAVSLKNYVR